MNFLLSYSPSQCNLRVSILFQDCFSYFTLKISKIFKSFGLISHEVYSSEPKKNFDKSSEIGVASSFFDKNHAGYIKMYKLQHALREFSTCQRLQVLEIFWNGDLGNLLMIQDYKLQMIHNQIHKSMHLCANFVIFHPQHAQVYNARGRPPWLCLLSLRTTSTRRLY